MSELIENNIPESAEPDELEIRSDIEAGWQLKRRKEIIADRDELISFYKDRIKAVEEDSAFKIGLIDRALFAFFKTVKHKKTATQESYQHPLGKLVLKKQAPEFKRKDQEVIDWLKKNNGGEFIKVEENLDWAALKKVSTVVGKTIVNEDGVIIPGIEVIEREDKFTVE